MASGSKVSKVRAEKPGQRPETVTLKVTVPRETARLLRLEAFGRDCSLGLVVEEMVRAAPRRFVLTDRSKGAPMAEGQPMPPGPSVAPPTGPRLSTGLQEAS